MTIFKKFIFLIFILSTVLGLVWWKRLWIASRLSAYYFQKNNLEIRWQITHWDWNSLRIENIHVNPSTEVQSLEIDYSIKQKTIQKVSVHIRRLDLETVTKMSSSRPSAPSPSSTPPQFKDLKSVCHILQNLNIQVRLDDITWGAHKISPQAVLQKTEDGAKLSWNSTETEGQLALVCKSNVIALNSESFLVNLKNSDLRTGPLWTLHLKMTNMGLQWTPQRTEWRIPYQAVAEVRQQNKSWPLKIDEGLLRLSAESSQPLVWYAHLKVKKFQLSPLVTQQIDWKSRVDLAGAGAPGEFDFEIQDLSWQDPQHSVQRLRLFGKGDWKDKNYNAKFNLEDRPKSVRVSDFKIQGGLSPLHARLQFEPQNTSVHLSKKLFQTLPSLQPLLTDLRGSLRLAGDLLWESDVLKGKLLVLGDAIGLSSEAGDIEGLSFAHQIDSFTRWTSPPGQKISLQKIKVGPEILDLKTTYQIESLKKIKVKELQFAFEEAQVKAQNFEINAVQKRIENFWAVILHLSLKKALALGLKDAVRAQGTLQGHIKIDFDGRKPIIQGLLAAPIPGWIRYRTVAQQKQLSFQDSPMDILNSYLYNFHYKELSLNLSSDTNYDMKMHLNAFGQNPDFLNGKPLKLNVNLEQNLLAALRSLMLTYKLPSQIQERLERMDP